jgi:serine/threonine-protein kinase
MPDEPGPSWGTRYEILGTIAKGEVCSVYRARDTCLQRLVALKVLHQNTQPALQALCREAETLINLDHPNIVSLYSLSEYQGQAFVAMQWIDGDPLTRSLPQFLGDESAAAWLLAKVARAVDHVHQRGLLHRDLTPENILLDADGEPYLIGFDGGVRPLAAEPGPKEESAVMGSIAHLAPEQVKFTQPLTPAVDVYALGVILFQLLTNRIPFQGKTALDILMQKKEHDPQRPSLHDPDLDPELEAICLQCLGRDPRSRYSAAGLADALEHWLRGEPA